MIPSSHKKTFAVAAVIITVIAAAVIYTVFDPTLPWFPKCMFKQFTGLDCPGCGSQRAIHAMLSGDVTAALRYNPLIFILLPVVAALFISEFYCERIPRLYRVIHTRTFILTIVVMIMAWWILRNIF